MKRFSSSDSTRIVDLTGHTHGTTQVPGYPLLVACGPELGPEDSVSEEVLRRWVWKVPSSVTKTCVYHDIPSYFGISKVIIKYEALV